MMVHLFILLCLLPGFIKSRACFLGLCNCEEDMAVCIDVVWVRFTYSPRIRILYLKQIQIEDIDQVLNNFPSLKYWTMMDMIYFNCSWIKEIPKDIRVITNMCIIEGKIGNLDINYPIIPHFLFLLGIKYDVHIQKVMPH